MKKDHHPPKWADRLLMWFCSARVVETLQGDLHELYIKRRQTRGKLVADLCFIRDVFDSCRPFALRSIRLTHLTYFMMFRNYFQVGFRNLLKNSSHSFVNIGGLAIGMTVVTFIGLWVHDELSFNKYHKNYRDIAQVWHFELDPQTQEIRGGQSIQYPVAATLRDNYPELFRHVLLAWWIGNNTLAYEDKKFTKTGQFIESGVIDMLSLKMLKGSVESLNSPNAIILSKSAAESFFGADDPINKVLIVNGSQEFEITGIYEDIPKNNRFSEVQFFGSWQKWLTYNKWAQGKESDWDNRPFNIFVQVQPGVTAEQVNMAIKDMHEENVPPDFYKTIEHNKPYSALIPMSTWHLYGEVTNGKPAGGRITYVWMFGIIGAFVLLLACINFVNLSTARSEKRAREVGVRKTMGSGRANLVSQFLSESMMVVLFAFVLSIVIAASLLTWFNLLADKQIAMPLDSPWFWLASITFIGLTTVMAGMYPAFFLSSFQPASVLKGVFRSGRLAALPRKVLVVVQFTVSIVMIAGTLIVYKQIQFARSRPIGYERKNLVTLDMNDPNYKGKLEVIRTELISAGAAVEVSASSAPLTAITNMTNGYDWPGKDPTLDAEFAICNISRDYGRTVDWEMAAGRDFSEEFSQDSVNAVIINEAAVAYMGLKDPVGKELKDVDEFGKVRWTKTIIGVVKDLVVSSPYEPVTQALYYYYPRNHWQLHIRMNPSLSAIEALSRIEKVLRKIAPTALFDYKFADEEYAHKFRQEERVGKLSGVFAALAIFISCLGLFGLASYVAERRTKEVGIRKVVGASVYSLWKLLSKDFIWLVVISCIIASPIAYYFLSNWLQQFSYRTEISLWIFVVTGAAALTITMITVSYQAIKAARMNPVSSLRLE